MGGRRASSSRAGGANPATTACPTGSSSFLPVKPELGWASLRTSVDLKRQHHACQLGFLPSPGRAWGREGTGGLLAPPLPRGDPWPLPCLGTRLGPPLSQAGAVGWAGWAVVSCAGCLPGPQCPPCLGFLPVLVHCAPYCSPRGEGTGRDWAANFGAPHGQDMPGTEEPREVTSGLSRQCHWPCGLQGPKGTEPP